MADVPEEAVNAALAADAEWMRRSRSAVFVSPSRDQVRVMLEAAAPALRQAWLSAVPAGGELVRQTWVYWALEQPDVAEHPNWVKSWAEIDERDREADDRIYSAVAAKAVHDAGLVNERMRLQLMAFAAERDRTIRALERRAERAVPGVERDAWLAAAEVARGGGVQERGEGDAGDVR